MTVGGMGFIPERLLMMMMMSIHLHHINRNQRYCNFCTQNHNTNTVEDEEHVLFHCPEYDNCRQEYPDLLLGNMSIKNISEFDNQETIAKLLIFIFFC